MPPFRFSSQGAHFTISGHVEPGLILAMLRSKQPTKPLRWYSICWETSDEANAYDHTHFACEWQTRLDIRDARAFDINGVHPHLAKITGRAHAIQIYDIYHKKQEPRLLLSQSETSPHPRAASYEAIRGADNLLLACENMGITPKTVSDIALIRRDVPLEPPFRHRYPAGDWTVPIPDFFWNIFMYGPTQTGKTQWALHVFQNPLLVSHMDDLKKFDKERHDGIVFDDMSFHHLPREAIIHLVDFENDRSIHARFTCAQIPAGTRKIFTSNKSFQEVFPVDESGAIRARFSKIIHIHGPTFIPNNIANGQNGHGLLDAPVIAEGIQPGEVAQEAEQVQANMAAMINNWDQMGEDEIAAAFQELDEIGLELDFM